MFAPHGMDGFRGTREDMPEYLLILRDHEERWEAFSNEEYQDVLAQFMAWNESMKAQDELVDAGKLTGPTSAAR